MHCGACLKGQREREKGGNTGASVRLASQQSADCEAIAQVHPPRLAHHNW
jgi:hypothetical protein